MQKSFSYNSKNNNKFLSIKEIKKFLKNIQQSKILYEKNH